MVERHRITNRKVANGNVVLLDGVFIVVYISNNNVGNECVGKDMIAIRKVEYEKIS